MGGRQTYCTSTRTESGQVWKAEWKPTISRYGTKCSGVNCKVHAECLVVTSPGRAVCQLADSCQCCRRPCLFTRSRPFLSSHLSALPLSTPPSSPPPSTPPRVAALTCGVPVAPWRARRSSAPRLPTLPYRPTRSRCRPPAPDGRRLWAPPQPALTSAAKAVVAGVAAAAVSAASGGPPSVASDCGVPSRRGGGVVAATAAVVAAVPAPPQRLRRLLRRRQRPRRRHQTARSLRRPSML